MYQALSRRLKVLVMHADPLLCAGLLASLREHPDLEVCADGEESTSNHSRFDVVIADYHDAMRLRRLATSAARGPLADARILTKPMFAGPSKPASMAIFCSGPP
jgi:hypothetical protein